MPESKPSIFLSADFFEFCSKCKKYLSVGPVTIFSDKPLCGRCPNPKAAPASFYDRLAQHMFFPCINDRYGCDSMLAWGSVKAHEMICKYAQLECPAWNCFKNININEVNEHFEANHKELVASNLKFEVPCSNEDENSQVNKFFLWHNQAFILKINFFSSSCFCCVSSWGSSNSEKLKYDLLIEGEDKKKSVHINDVPIGKYTMKFHDNHIMTRLDVDILKRALHAKTIVCTVIIAEETRKITSVNESLLSEVECPICLVHMKPPIYMCTAGHSICRSCKSNISKCPTCRVPLGVNRNVALEKVIEQVIFPCRNKTVGCCFTGMLSKVTLHEKNCLHSGRRTTKCYLSLKRNCSWSGPLSEMMSHLSQNHPDSYLDLTNSAVFDLKNFNVLQRFTEYNGQIFKVHVSRDGVLGLQFVVKLMEHFSFKNSGYQFHIDFKDLNENNRVLKVNDDCINAQLEDDDNLDLDNSFIIHDKLFKSFAKDGVIEVGINLVECGN